MLPMLLGAAAADGDMTLDDRRTGTLVSTLGTTWRGVSDRVMGGVSRETLSVETIAGESCLRLSGDVSLDNNGGFIQMALDLDSGGALDAAAYSGLQLRVFGNGESYNAHLRTPAARRPWQSYRQSFVAGPTWRDVRLPFSSFTPHRLDAPLDTSRLTRLGVVAIGRAFHADVCVAAVSLYR